jgi:hypothetical protein
LLSTLLMAFETVFWRTSVAPRPREQRNSATLTKIAEPSRSGSFTMPNQETMSFDNFHFQFMRLSIVINT